MTGFTGKLEAFASRAKIVHIDIDSAEIGKNKQPHVSVCADVKLALQGLNRILEGKLAKLKPDFAAWRAELKEQKLKFPLSYKTLGKPFLSVCHSVVDVWGFRSHGFGLPAAMGAAAANPEAIVVDIDGDGSFMMNVQWEDRFYKANRAHTYLGTPQMRPRSSRTCCSLQMLVVYQLLACVAYDSKWGAFKDVITEGDGRRSY
ncbi:hypothetical protein M0R45_025046 [Rubus argutus]|uniref:Acetolactate synthase n=1 Tax=Rubus argutus TaxID=59490 RepID=A0AAW1WW17_RUBAR